MSMVERVAGQVAKEAVGDEDSQPQDEGGEPRERGSWISILGPIIVTIIQSLVQNCPLPTQQMKEAFKRPHMRQRAAALKEVRDTCACCGVPPRFVGRIQNSLLVSASTISDVDADALIREAKDDRNLLV